MITTPFTQAEIAEYYRLRVPRLNQRGRQWRCPCPLHRGKHYSFSVNAETGCWYCFADCGRGGSLIDLEIEFTGADFRTALSSVFATIGRQPTDFGRPFNHRSHREKRSARALEYREAEYFGRAAVLLIEGELGVLPSDSPQRSMWTRLLLAIKHDAGQVFHTLKSRDPQAAAAWSYAGRQYEKRLQMKLASFVRGMQPEGKDRA